MSALAQQKTHDDLQIVEYSKTAAALNELSGKYKGVVFDVTTTQGMKVAREARAEIKGYRTDLEKLRKDIKAPALERCRLIDDEAKRITSELESLERPIDKQIKSEESRKEAERKAKEEAELKRVSAIQSMVAEIKNKPVSLVGQSSSSILAAKTIVESMDIGDEYMEFQGAAFSAKSETIEVLSKMAVDAEAMEAEQARIKAEREELARLRAAEEERQREEESRKQEEERQVREAREAEEARIKAEREAAERAHNEKMEAERKAHEDKLRAEREAAERDAAELRIQQEEERQRIATAKAAFERQQQEAEEAKRKAVSEAKTQEILLSICAQIEDGDITIMQGLEKAYAAGKGND